ncbi:MAG: AarF/ABC1/UbiB kinase family protein [Deltaproteobacteria bacterium]|nr:AarF/ABC1/UbiB kinase family protein [Deltaproteobacteria bacterium]
MDFQTITNLGRFKDIVFILLKYGFEDLVARLDLPGKRVMKEPSKEDRVLGTYERVRRALEDLGPTFIKFGQIMSLRPDLLPRPFIHELSKLQDEVHPEDFENVKIVVEQELKHSLKDLFTIFDPHPLAAASLSQVHRAVLRKEGRIVAVKVQRPKIRHKIEQDLNILAAVADRMHKRLSEVEIYDLPNLVRIVRKSLLRELDFMREAHHIKIALAHLDGGSDVQIPGVYLDYCTEKILTMDFVQGSRLKDRGINDVNDAQNLAKQGLRTIMKQILGDGFFHADPHPGNILITQGPSLCLIDWGSVGRLSRNARNELMDMVEAVVEWDSEKLMSTLLTITRPDHDVDLNALDRELMDILDLHFAVPLKEMHLGGLLLDISTVLREHRLRLPSDMGMTIKALVTAEGTAREIYPELNIVSEAEPYVRGLVAQRYKPSALWKNFKTKAVRFFSSQGRIPWLLTRIIDKVDRGDLNIQFEHRNLDGLKRSVENSFDRLTFGIIVAALIIGSSMIITTGVGPLLFGFPALGIIGYLLSACVGLWLVFNIIRSRRY